MKRKVSIHALRVEGDVIITNVAGNRRAVSIHALRVEGDLHNIVQVRLFLRVSIHALRVEGDGSVAVTLSDGHGVSIHALRVEGDMQYRSLSASPSICFYPRPPGGGRPWSGVQQIISGVWFLSTPSGWRATQGRRLAELGALWFLSTPSGWRATNPISGA